MAVGTARTIRFKHWQDTGIFIEQDRVNVEATEVENRATEASAAENHTATKTRRWGGVSVP